MTDADDIEVDEIIADYYADNPVIKNKFDLENIRLFLLNSLKFLPRQKEATRPLQIYWSINPLITTYKLLGRDLFQEQEEIIELVKQSLRIDFKQREYHHPHLMASFGTTLALHLLRYRFETDEKLKAVQMLLQLNNQKMGCFHANPEGETDVRVTYAAIVTALVMGLFAEFPDVCKLMFQNTARYIKSKQSHQGGFGSNSPEPHAAYTYCALAGLKILHDKGIDVENTYLTKEMIQMNLNYLLNRQTKHGGFNGRPNKHVDGCYSFWVLASIHLLNPAYLKLVDVASFDKFVYNCCQDEEGLGLRDKPNVYPDGYHTGYVLHGWCVLHGLLECVELGY